DEDALADFGCSMDRPCPLCGCEHSNNCVVCTDFVASGLMRQQDLQSAEEFKWWCRTAAQWLRRRLAKEPGLAACRMDKRCYYLCRRLGQIAPQWLSADDLPSIPRSAPITGDVDPLALLAGLARFSSAAPALTAAPPASGEVRPGTAAAAPADE